MKKLCYEIFDMEWPVLTDDSLDKGIIIITIKVITINIINSNYTLNPSDT